MTVAMFTTYAPSEGFGGPARALHQRYVLEAAGYPTVHVVLQARHQTGSLRPVDFARVVDRPHRAPIDHIYHDVDLGLRAVSDRRLVDELIAHLRAAGTTVIVLEQPFLLDVAEAAATALSVPIVYSCQNIEHALRRDLERFQPDWRRRTDRADEVRRIEARAVAMSSAVTSICLTDQIALREHFGVDSTIVPNGTMIADAVHEIRAVDGDQPVDFVFAGSSYWPNIEGFAEIATPSLAFLPPTTRIHVVGSVGAQLLVAPAIDRHQSVNVSRMVVRGFLEMPQLVATMRAARAVLVPVFVGEGSNLKSADALASGRPVIMTERATRGYEDVLARDPEGVTVVANAADFRRAMLGHLGQPGTASVGAERARLLSWDLRLQPLVGVIREAR